MYHTTQFARPADRLRRFINLTVALTLRDIKGRYRRTLIGPLWVVIQPVMLMLVFTALGGVLGIETDGIPPVIFRFSALVPWTFFARVVNNTGPSVVGNGGIMKKINVTPEIFPLVAACSAAVDAAVASVVLVGMMAWFQVPLGPWLLWVLPLGLLLALLSLSMGMFIAALGVFRRDFIFASSFLVQLLLYSTPIIYPISEVPERWRTLYQLNPLVGLLEGFRSVVAKGEAPDLDLLLMALPGVALAMIVAWPLYRYLARYFADVL